MKNPTAPRRARKRSATARLVLMGAVPLLLTACEGQESASLYANAEECANAGRLTATQCESAFESAHAEHDRVAPRYSRREDCVRDFGEEQCARDTQHHSAFVPFMGGVLLGRMLDGGSRYAQPVYRPRGGQWQTPDGQGIGTRTGDLRVDKSALKPQPRAITMSRSGFGSRAAARGSWGG